MLETIANQNANQLFQLEEEEKLNYFNSEALKKTIATQVDYVALIVSRHNEEWRYQDNVVPTNVVTAVQQVEYQSSPPLPIKDVENDDLTDNTFKSISPKRQYTVHSQSHSITNSNHPLALSI